MLTFRYTFKDFFLKPSKCEQNSNEQDLHLSFLKLKYWLILKKGFGQNNLVDKELRKMTNTTYIFYYI